MDLNREFVSIRKSIEELQEQKIKVRQDALDQVDDFLAWPNFARKFSKEQLNWMALFQSLSIAVNNERNLFVQKAASSVATGRLEKAGRVMRNAIERSVTHLKGKAIDFLLNHMMKDIKGRGTLLQPLALNYVKSMVAICSYPPHIEHMKTDQWINLVGLALNVVLDNHPIDHDFPDEVEDEFKMFDIADTSSDEMDVDSESLRIGTKRVMKGPGPSQPRKRSRVLTATTSGLPRTVSQEQVEFMELLLILIKSPRAPFLRDRVADRIVHCLTRFFHQYRSWTIAHMNAISSVNVVMTQLELNRVKLCTNFGLQLWPLLLSYWSGKEKKDKIVKEELTIALTTFFSLITAPVSKTPSQVVSSRLESLMRCFQDDIDRSAFDNLPLDNLRFELASNYNQQDVFRTSVIMSGLKFEPSNVLSWGILALHADCIGVVRLILHDFISSIDATCSTQLHLYFDDNVQANGARSSSPIVDLIATIKKETLSTKKRCDFIQVLFFVIDRHWNEMHEDLQAQISSTLLALFVYDDLQLQSWVLLCLAAIVAAPGTKNDLSLDWQAMWTQAVYRTNAVGVARAAAHTAHIILVKQKVPIHRVLGDIETFASNLVIQGPSFPYDGICAFLCDCLQLANQDMRLYRLQFPDKVLVWLMQSWSTIGPEGRHQLPPQSPFDIFRLLQETCGLSSHLPLPTNHLLPESILTDNVMYRHRTKAHRNFLLFHRLHASDAAESVPNTPVTKGSFDEFFLQTPSPREIRVSNLLIKLLELLVSDWKLTDEGTFSDTTPEKVRRTLDLVVVALFFEALLTWNGTRSNRRVLQLACQLITSVVSYLSGSKWKPKEGAMMLDGLRPLIYYGDKEDCLKDLLLQPSVGSGVRRNILVKMSTRTSSNGSQLLRDLQHIVWKWLDIQHAFAPSRTSFLNLLFEMEAFTENQISVEGDEDFAPTRTIRVKPVTSLVEPRAHRFCVNILLEFLTFVPVLQSGTTQPEHNRDLFEKLLECDPVMFRELARPFLKAVQRGHVHFSVNMATKFLHSLEKVLTRIYQFACSVESNLLAVQFLFSTSHLWIEPGMDESDLGYYVQLLHDWLTENIIEDRVLSWEAREYLVRYLEHYLNVDPGEVFWAIPFVKEVKGEEIMKPDKRCFPSALLPKMGDDEDVRVRLRAAVANGHVLIAVQKTNLNPIPTYDAIKSSLSVDLDRTELIWTRSVHLANAMIVSSAVRRGAYWHLLETCLYEHKEQKESIEVLLSAVASRLGYSSLQELFETYAPQLMQSFKLSGQSFFLLPHSLLGYENSRVCAQRTFPLLGPMILTGDDTNGFDSTNQIFLEHCSMAKLTFEQGMSRCFPEAIAIMIAAWIDADDTVTEDISMNIKTIIERWIHNINPEEDLTTRINANLDLIVFTILRTVRDTDYSKDGTIVDGLKAEGLGERSAATFVALNAYRKSVGFTMHETSPPAFDSGSVIRSILWLKGSFPRIGSPYITYHVIHRFMTAIETCTLVNEQLRLAHGLTIWISMNVEMFTDISILRLLLRGTMLFLTQYDLARVAQGIIAWSLGQYRLSMEKDSSVSEILGYIAKISHDWSMSSDPDSESLGTELLKWIEKEIITLYDKSPEKRGQVHDALVLWPGELTERLASISSDNIRNISSIFRDNLSASKFRIVRKLAQMKEYSGGAFCRRHFWHLKNWIPAPEEIQDDDIDGFTELLFKHSSRLRSLDTEFVDPNPLTELHLNERATANRQAAGRRGAPTTKNVEADLFSLRSIVRYLLHLLVSGTSSQVHRSYTTLRQIFGLDISQFKDLNRWEDKFRKDISYFVECPLPVPSQSSAAITDLETIVERPFEDWIRNVAGVLNRILSGVRAYYSPLSSFIDVDAIFAQQILPLLVHALLVAIPSARSSLSKFLSSVVTNATSSKHCSAVIETIIHLRNFQQTNPNFAKDPLSYDKWLDMDFRQLSRGAIKCGAYTTSLLFLELAAEYAPVVGFDNEREEILYIIYSHIEEPDGFYAIKTTNMFNFLTKRFHHEGQWDMAFRFHGAEMAAGSQASQDGVSRSLHAFGFDNLAMSMLQSSQGGGLDSSKLAYEMAWRTQMWDLPEPQLDEQVGATLYIALRAVHRNRDHKVIDDLVMNAARNEMQRLRYIGNEDMVTIQDRIRSLICLGEIRRWKRNYPETNIPSTFSEKFLNLPPGASFITSEEVVATRLSLLLSIKQREKRDQLGNLERPILTQIEALEKKCLLRLSETARVSGKAEVALNAITRARTLESTPSFEILEEFSNVLWLLKEHKSAAEGLRTILSESEIPSLDQTKAALALSRLGTWWAEACFQKPTDIQNQCFLPALRIIQKLEGKPDPSLAVVFHQYALFAETQYHSILSSPAVVQLKDFWEKKSSEVAEWEQSVHFPHFRKFLDPQMKAFAEEDKLYKSHFTSCRQFLVQAIQMYSSCLAFSDEFDDSAVIRLCSLWFANFELQVDNSTAELAALGTNTSIKPSNEDIEKEFGQALLKVPSRKFIFLAHQLSARLDADKLKEHSQVQLRELILRMCREHPFHSLYQVCALSKIHQAPASTRRASLYSFTSTARARAASSILAQCGQFDELTRSRAAKIQYLCKAYLEFATWSVKEKVKGKTNKNFPIPDDKQLARIVDIPVPPVTAYIAIDLSNRRYEDVVTITRYGSNFHVLGGQAVPKICECLGSNGIVYRQLFKGEGDSDDLRQDAIMEQVFELVNVLLRRDHETNKRELRMRTYKVIPLSHNAGVIEFVKDTQQFHEWLRVAHPRYNPKDVTADHCTTTALSWQPDQDAKTPEEMRDGFITLLKHFHPVFRHFFTELHKLPMSWFGSRLRYARSVATTSIIGHILGLGDRHTKNILIDKVNGEMVHIDLGIAFDQGLRLRVPELVPFRLTQNLVDGLGTTGTEGVFRRCAEETLRVLRAESGVILSVLEVFKHDPLHQWATTAEKIRKVQDAGGHGTIMPDDGKLTRGGTVISEKITTTTATRTSEKEKPEHEQRDLLAEFNKQEADRALTSVRRKLDQSLSVEYVVNDLITSATDPMNLGQIFPGWSPWW